MQNKMKLDAEIFDADLNENRCKFARQPQLGMSVKFKTLYNLDKCTIWTSV